MSRLFSKRTSCEDRQTNTTKLKVSLRRLFVSMSTSSHVGQCSTVFNILGLVLQSSSQYSLFSDHALWRYLRTYACSLTRLSVLNENKINTVRRIDTVSRVEKLPAKHGLSCWKMTKWTRFFFSVFCKQRIAVREERATLDVQEMPTTMKKYCCCKMQHIEQRIYIIHTDTCTVMTV